MSLLPAKNDWKTKTGSILLAIGLALQGIAEFFPYQSLVVTILIAVGTALGGIGLADKARKILDK